ncbi:MAG: FHA domain-containing protein [Leptolyngbyaceae cyanobacterium RU_5_1]|nr:FHA domain-containing protein [Leptolyngbyaceae cyanobacterium RU_5_1]
MNAEQRYLLIVEDDRGCKEYMLDAPSYSLGRDPKCDIRLVSQFVSRRHATLVQLLEEDGTHHYRIVDGIPKGKPSSNGLLVNGRKLQACDLQDKDEIVFGPSVRAIYRLREQNGERLVSLDETIIPPGSWDIGGA